MMGLLIKDFKLMKNQRNFFLFIFVVAICLAGADQDPSFVVTYVTFIGSVFTLSTVSYDEYDNGNAYLFSLPITRKGYIIEKYGFGLITGGCAWLMGTILCFLMGYMKGWGTPADTLMDALMILPLFLILLAVTLPFQVKFGSEKGRAAVAGALGILIVAGAVAVTLVKAWNPGLITAFNNLSVPGIGMVIGIELIVAALLFLLSGRISVSILEKKEF